jgi:hypothetical protein
VGFPPADTVVIRISFPFLGPSPGCKYKNLRGEQQWRKSVPTILSTKPKNRSINRFITTMISAEQVAIFRNPNVGLGQGVIDIVKTATIELLFAVVFGRASLWWRDRVRCQGQEIMPIFVERFVLTILAFVVTGVCFLNPWKWDWQQRWSLFLGVTFIAYFAAYTSYRSTTSPAATVVQTPKSGDAHTSGPNSPAVTGGGNNIQYDGSSHPERKVDPPQKDKQ